MKYPPNEEQQRIISESGNCVVIANPGSGKTFTVSQKLRQILPELSPYKGVIAISYTNKASFELEKRCLGSGIDRKSSFFGTIDKFFCGEIIIPFGSHLFGLPQREVTVIQLKELEDAGVSYSEVNLGQYDKLVANFIPRLADLYVKGYIVLETFGLLSVYIFRKSPACQRYLKAKYSHLIIDEYQDCGDWQHEMFISLVRLGVKGIAVGDANQSIFTFAGKHPKYLLELTTRDDFTVYEITKNYRCHPSIVNYSLRLLNEDSPLFDADEKRVYWLNISGTECDIAVWLSTHIPKFSQDTQTACKNMAILVKSNREGKLIYDNMHIPCKLISSSPLDEDPSLWATVFKKILLCIFSPDLTKYEVAEEFSGFNQQEPLIKKVLTKLGKIEEVASRDRTRLCQYTNDFVDIAKLVFPSNENQSAVDHLSAVLQDEEKLDGYTPPDNNQVQIMTLHKSKGLEFEIVFHLSLYEWILPQKFNGSYANYNQDLNLHYVGITRAKSLTVLCTSTHRHRFNGDVVQAAPSEFLKVNKLHELRP